MIDGFRIMFIKCDDKTWRLNYVASKKKEAYV